jgi:hypothetical protein
MTNPSPQNLQLRKWILDKLDGSHEFETALENAIVEALGTVLTTRGDLLTRDGTGAVRLAKGAQNTLLTMGANDPAWGTLSTAIDNAIGSTRGSILYRGASGWTILAPGTSGNVLTSNGSGADPSYKTAGAVQYLDSKTASNSATLDFTSGINANFANYEFQIENLVPVTDQVSFNVLYSTDAGSSWLSTGYININADSTQIPITATSGTSRVANAAGIGLSGRFTLYSPSNSSRVTWFAGIAFWRNSVLSNTSSQISHGYNTTTSAITGIRFVPSSGNFSTGTIRMFGIKGS